jgi:hypothetical protein
MNNLNTNVCNQGIAHLSFRPGGQPLCRSRTAHICVAISDKEKWPRICARCEKKLAKRKPENA